ncbi:AAA family ATPase [Methylosinus sp. RM1]|uniref:AAA family ATPase n=1 Tax=Methylosinus sp. RM1 TaxID=2583817 RepID=UPI001407C607|nr:AAA family ATPase [Methylosinus sp. RM1]
MTIKPTAFLLHGFLGAGKTTLAKRLEVEQNALRFTHDEWMSRLYGADPPEAEFEERARRVYAVMEDLWTRSIDLGTNVVLDFGFWSRAERTRVRELVASRGGKPVLCRLSCPDDVAWRRIARRNEQPAGSLYIAPATFRLLKSRFESLEPDEDRVEIASTTADGQSASPPPRPPRPAI